MTHSCELPRLVALLRQKPLSGAGTHRPPSLDLECEEGCPLGAALAEAACGSDGLTYASACLAHCQGVWVVHSGPCEHDGSMGIAALLDMGGMAAGGRGNGSGGRALLLDEVEHVSRSTLDRYKLEGFR
jgi:hypothetical protein